MKLCLVGTGGAASAHAKIVRSLSGARLMAVCGTSESHTTMFARKHHIPRTYNRLEQMFENENVDGVIIASIPSRHCRDILLASNYVKKLIVEKPVACNMKEINKIKEFVKSRKVSVSVVYQNRYSNSYHLLRNELKDKTDIVTYIHLELADYRNSMYYSGPGKWRKSFSKSGGGVLLQNGIHWINFIFSIFGYDYKLRSVECSYQDNVETESAISIRALVNRKIPCDMFMSRMNRSQPSLLKIYTQEETIELNESYFNKKKILHNKSRYTFFSKFSRNFPIRFTYPNLKHRGSYKDFLKDFIKSNSRGKTESIFFEDACKDVEFVDTVYNWLRR